MLMAFTAAINQSMAADPSITLEQLRDSALSIGLALGGGGAKGLAHIGVIRALEEAGIKIDYIAGTSMGALVGAVYASGFPIDTLEKIAIETDWKTTAKLFSPGLSASGFVDGKKVKEFLYTFYGDKKIEDLAIPFAATATDISNGKLYVINKGSVIEAVRASISIPVVFTPVQHGESFLVDGGLVNAVPIDIVREMGADYVIAVHIVHTVLPSQEKEYIEILSEGDDKKKPLTLDTLSHRINEYINKIKNQKEDVKPTEKNALPKIAMITQNSVHIAADAVANLQVALYKPEMLIEPDTRRINLYEFYRGKEAVEIGYNEAQKVLDALK
ncbi:MAG: patatin-like phospholipase family protein [Candidatus Neomarinimicrobiota bacterium]